MTFYWILLDSVSRCESYVEKCKVLKIFKFALSPYKTISQHLVSFSAIFVAVFDLESIQQIHTFTFTSKL